MQSKNRGEWRRVNPSQELTRHERTRFCLRSHVEQEKNSRVFAPTLCSAMNLLRKGWDILILFAKDGVDRNYAA
jgi:hypothetical protein